MSASCSIASCTSTWCLKLCSRAHWMALSSFSWATKEVRRASTLTFPLNPCILYCIKHWGATILVAWLSHYKQAWYNILRCFPCWCAYGFFTQRHCCFIFSQNPMLDVSLGPGPQQYGSPELSLLYQGRSPLYPSWLSPKIQSSGVRKTEYKSWLYHWPFGEAR